MAVRNGSLILLEDNMQIIIDAIKEKQIELIQSDIEIEKYYYITKCLNEALLQLNAADKALKG
jgi:hypothetical protein